MVGRNKTGGSKKKKKQDQQNEVEFTFYKPVLNNNTAPFLEGTHL